MRIDRRRRDLVVGLLVVAHAGDQVAPGGAGGFVEGSFELGADDIRGCFVGAEGVLFRVVALVEEMRVEDLGC